MNKHILIFFFCCISIGAWCQKKVPIKPRILISTDIGGTDPDDNQSMAHLLMYSNRFDIEGLVSSPSYGNGNKSEILRMIDLYQKDLPKLQAHEGGFPTADYLRSIAKQGVHGGAPYQGYSKATEGSRWIIECAMRPSKQPLWVLVWGGLEDLAEALHDEPEIQRRIRVYYIGGPNKKWGANSYAYIASHFPDLWFIESNATFTGIFTDDASPDSLKKARYYASFIENGGYLGRDFKSYYKGEPKMGDTPSLLYMMDGDPNDPGRDNWGGSYVSFKQSPRRVFERALTLKDTVPVYSILELRFKGPVLNIAADSACFTMDVYAGIGIQSWPGFYLGKGVYCVRYSPKKAENLTYKIHSGLPGFRDKEGALVVDNEWPGPPNHENYVLSSHWYTDRPEESLFFKESQGARTVLKWRNDFMRDWGKRWSWLK